MAGQHWGEHGNPGEPISVGDRIIDWLGVGAAICFAENALPSADCIRVMQEAHVREQARAISAIPQVRQRLPFPEPKPTLNEEDRSRLERALERFVYERPGELVDLRQVRP